MRCLTSALRYEVGLFRVPTRKSVVVFSFVSSAPICEATSYPGVCRPDQAVRCLEMLFASSATRAMEAE